MTPLQWIGLALGLLIVVTRVPLLIWPEPILGWWLTTLARNPRVILRSWGAFLGLLALAIGLTLTSPLSVLEQVMAVLAVLFVPVALAIAVLRKWQDDRRFNRMIA